MRLIQIMDLMAKIVYPDSIKRKIAKEIELEFEKQDSKIKNYKSALEWMVKNPGAHPNNVVRVAQDAINKHS